MVGFQPPVRKYHGRYDAPAVFSFLQTEHLALFLIRESHFSQCRVVPTAPAPGHNEGKPGFVFPEVLSSLPMLGHLVSDFAGASFEWQ